MFRKIMAAIVLLAVALVLVSCSGDSGEVPVISPTANLFNLEGDFRGSQTLAQLLDLPPETALVLYAEDGAIIKASATAEVEARQGKIYFQHERALLGIVVNPPTQANTYAHSWALDQVEAGKSALVVLVDGLGYELFSQSLDQGLVPNLARGEDLQAMTVFRPVTNAGLAAILTGETPDQNGIHDRKDRQPLVPDILQGLADLGKKGVVVEGNINILDLGGEVILNSDGNGDGFTDDDILETALANVEGYDYMLVHFHSLDDSGHNNGPRARATLDRLAVLDQYVGELLSAWPGPVLVVSDHGMHKTEEGGDHGQFRYEDMFVPMITFPWEAVE